MSKYGAGDSGSLDTTGGAPGVRREVELLQRVIADANTEIERLRGGREIEQEMIRNAVAQLAEKDDTIRRVKMELDHWVIRVTEDRNVMAKMATPELVAALTDQRDQALHDRDMAAIKTPMCCKHPAHFLPCTRCHGYDCAACDNKAMNDGDWS
jgi:hypothetical protein